jgi:hypothetical protein
MKGGWRSTSWQPGQSGNPNGRPRKPATIEARKILTDVKALARGRSEDAINTLEDVMTNAKAPAAARVAAATAILDRAWGKPTQHVEQGQPGDFERMSIDELTDYVARESAALGLTRS